MVASIRLVRATRTTTTARTAIMARMARMTRISRASLRRHSAWWTSSKVRGPSVMFAKLLHVRCRYFFSRSFAYTQKRFLCNRREVWTAPHRAQLTRATHAYFSRVHVAQDVWVSCVLFFVSVIHLIHVSRHFAWHTVFLTILRTVSFTCTQSDGYSFAALSYGESIQCHSARRVVLRPTGLNNLLSQVMSPGLSSKTAVRNNLSTRTSTISRPR